MRLDEDRAIKAVGLTAEATAKRLHAHIAETILALLAFAGSKPRAISIEDVTVTFKAEVILCDGKSVKLECHKEGPQRYTHHVGG